MKSPILLFCFLCCSLTIFSQAAQEITNLLDAYAQHQRLSGTVLVKQGEQLIFSKAYGCSNYEISKENDLNTIFNIGSLSKQFTAAAILTLVQNNQLDLHSPINTYLGKYASKRWKKVTVHHLLTHTSGIPSLLQSGHGLDDVFPEKRVVSLAELIGYFKELKLLSNPGKKYSYNNSGYVLLAAIIEEVSGETYGDFLQKNLFETYGLQHTSHGIQYSESLAFPYYNYTEQQRKKAPHYHFSWFIGAGSIYSTVLDLAKWNGIIHSDAFLTKELRQLYFEPYENAGNGKYYTYGWEIIEKKGNTFFHHDGTTFGYTCDLLYEPKTELLSIMLTNQTHESLNLLGKSEDFVRQTNFELIELVKGKKAEPLPTIQVANPNLIAGTYSFANDYQLKITKEEEVWTIASDQYSPLSLSYEYPIELNTPLRQSASRAVDGIVQKKFSKFAKEADGTMKVLTRLGLIRLGLNSIMKGMGKWERSVIYKEKDHTVYFRLFCENGAVDFFIAYNEEGKIQGIFDIDKIKYNEVEFPKTLSVYSTQQGLYLNGFAFGMEDAALIFDGSGKVIFQQLGRDFEGVLVN